MNDTQKLVKILAGLLAGLASGIGHASSALMVSKMITQQIAEGRTTFTPEEWDKIQGDDEIAKAALQAWLDANAPA